VQVPPEHTPLQQSLSAVQALNTMVQHTLMLPLVMHCPPQHSASPSH
jgi:hypothetical protein